MGILESLTGRTKVLRYRIVFGAGNIVGVSIEPCVPRIPEPDYIRLWASYEVLPPLQPSLASPWIRVLRKSTLRAIII